MTIMLVCERCGRDFIYDAALRQRGVMPRKNCPGCTRLILNESKARRRQGGGGQVGRPTDDLLALRATHKEVAHALQMNISAVLRTEQAALKKVRKHPELLEAWSNFKSDGMPTPGRQPPEAVLLAYQAEVAKWWRTLERLEAADCAEEAREMAGVIAGFQREIQRGIEELR